MNFSSNPTTLPNRCSSLLNSPSQPGRSNSMFGRSGRNGSAPLSLGGGEFREKLFDRHPIFFGSIGVLVFSEGRRSMDACDLRNESNFSTEGEASKMDLATAISFGSLAEVTNMGIETCAAAF